MNPKCVETTPAIDWSRTDEEDELLDRIAERAVQVDQSGGGQLASLFPSAARFHQHVRMDVLCVHNNIRPLRLAALAGADAFNFRHDVMGILNCLDRDRITLRNHFEPRYTDYSQPASRPLTVRRGGVR